MQLYPDLYRLRYEHIALEPKKRYIPEHKSLFKQELVITEKIDGSQMAVGFKGGEIYLQGKGSHIPKVDSRLERQFCGAWSWAEQNYEAIQNLQGYLVFGEWMRVQHNLPYDNLPDWFVAFDVWENKTQRFLSFWDARHFAEGLGLATVPVLYEGRIKYSELPDLVESKKSNFSTSRTLAETRFSPEEQHNITHARIRGQTVLRFQGGTIDMEGCVLKPAANPKYETRKKEVWWTNCAKLVSQVFLDEIEELDAHWTSVRRRENKLAKWYQK